MQDANHSTQPRVEINSKELAETAERLREIAADLECLTFSLAADQDHFETMTPHTLSGLMFLMHRRVTDMQKFLADLPEGSA